MVGWLVERHIHIVLRLGLSISHPANGIREGNMFNLESLLHGCGMQIAQPLIVIVSVVVGLSALLYGYRLFRLFVFLAGFALGTGIACFFTDTPTAVAAGLVSGTICCVLWYLGVFALGASLGAIVALAAGLGDSTAVVIVAVMFGFIAIAIRKLMIVVSTSYFGATLLVGAITPIMGCRDMIAQLVMSLVVAIVGVICQYIVTSGKGYVSEASPASPHSNSKATKNEGLASCGQQESKSDAMICDVPSNEVNEVAWDENKPDSQAI